MAGSIPPLISSSPPPLNAFDDDEEEDEDEFGGYAVAEDIDYNECMSFKENNDEKERGGTSRKEQDNTSQDSATDSGLCPDSEGVSPTPHSDDERSKNPAHLVNGHLESAHPLTNHVESPREVSISNGYQETSDDHNHTVDTKHFASSHPTSQEENSSEVNVEFDSEFGNFEFASTSTLETSQVVINEDNPESFAEFKSVSGIFSEHSEDIAENGNLEKNDVFVGVCGENKDETSDQPNAHDEEEFLPFDNNLDKREPQEINFDRLNGSFEEPIETEPPDFSQMQSVPPIVNEVSNDIEVKSSCLNSDNDLDDDEFDDFTDFKATFPNSDIPESEPSEFSEHSKSSSDQVRLSESCIKSISKTPQNDASDDEFSNFADFSSSDCAFVSAQSSNSAENSSYIPVKPVDDNDLRTDCDFQEWVSVFPASDLESVNSSGSVALLAANDSVWTRLTPLESSPAFNYHWTDSLSNRSLLKALSIDSRNILWGVPRFAANLNCGVLQPMKALEPLQPTFAAASPTYAHLPVPETVPDAHFDWGSSGLTNPLDCSHSSLLDLDLLMSLSSQLSACPRPPVLNLPKTLSVKAEKILSSLPDLSYMRKSYIVFPINEGR